MSKELLEKQYQRESMLRNLNSAWGWFVRANQANGKDNLELSLFWLEMAYQDSHCMNVELGPKAKWKETERLGKLIDWLCIELACTK